MIRRQNKHVVAMIMSPALGLYGLLTKSKGFNVSACWSSIFRSG